MSTHKCKQFIRPSPTVSINHLPTVQSATSTSWKNYPVIPHNDSTSYSSPAHLRFANVWQPPSAYGALLSQPRRLGVAESVGFKLYLARHLSDHSQAHNHEKHRDVAGEIRSRDININGNENDALWFIPPWLRWLFGSVITLWGGHMADLLKIERDVEKAAEMVEDIAEAVEKVASMTEEISKDIEEEFPQDGAINKVAHFVENLSVEVIEDAHTTHEFIHQMTSTEKLVETSIETAIEALEGLINAKPAIFKSLSDQDEATKTHIEKTNSQSNL
eukprot:PITA_32934